MADVPLNLETLISRETLRKSLANVVLAFVVLFIVSVIYVSHQNKETHHQRIAYLSDKLDSTLSNFQQQVVNLAENDLIINSIVDYSNRDNYLPIFFRSLKLNNSNETSIVFTDYMAEVITGKNIELHQSISQKFQWREQVLEQGKSYYEFSNTGLFVASPVLFSDFPEGAIVSYIKNIQELVQVPSSEVTVIYINNANQILYSSNIQQFSPGMMFEEGKNNLVYTNKQDYLTGRIVSIEPLASAYGKIFWLAIIIIISLVSVFLGLMSNVKRTAKFASNSMQELHLTLAEAIGKSARKSHVVGNQDEPVEFIAIREEFNTLLNDLFKQSISLKKFTSVINSIGEILVVLDSQRNLMLYNKSFTKFCEHVGEEHNKVLSKILPDYYLEGDNSDGGFEILYDFSCPVNQEIKCAVQWGASDYIDENGDVLGSIFVGKDVSIAKQLEIELLVKNQAIESAQTAIVITDALEQGQPIIYANNAFYSLTGYLPDQIIGANCRVLQGPNTEQDAIAKIRSAIKASKPITVTLTNYKKDGSDFKNELTLTPITDENGVVTHYLGIQIDVTAREATQKYLKIAKQEAEESTQLKSEFLASMSHEIRTPMNGVIGMIDLMLSSELSHDQKHNAEVAKNSANSLLTIINDILDFSKIEAGKLEIETIAFDLLALLSEVTETHAQQAHEKGIAIIVDLSAIDISLVSGDAGRIRQILHNLLSNAIKFTSKGEVLLSAKLLKGPDNSARLQCSVKDTGIGIAANRLSHIFDSFTQADSSTTRMFGGTGLGLAITAKLCQLMGGEVSVTSEEGQGSCFSFDIHVNTARSETTEHAVKLTNRSILVLDEDKHSAQVLAKQLTKWGAKVSVETNHLAYVKCLTQEYDVAFIDSKINSTNAIDFVKERTAQFCDSTALVLITKLNENHDKDLIQKVGFRDYLAKPTTVSNLKLLFERVFNQDVTASIEIFKPEQQTEELRKITILLVEDNRTNQLVAKKVLTQLGCDITIANNGQEAIEILNQAAEPYEIVFMDCQMPVMDGYQATEKIRQGAAGNQYISVPIIAMTANAMKGDKEKCLLHGMNDYVSKPINIDILREKISRW